MELQESHVDAHKRLIIIGLDGATFDLIIPWMKEGRLPTFKRLMEGGVFGTLASTRPPLTCPAWPAFMTGKNPGKFGVADFILDGEGGPRVANLIDIMGEPFWDTAGREDRRSIIINVPVTYPPRIVNGILFSGMLTPPGQPCWSSEEIFIEVTKAVGEYVADLDIMTLSSLDRQGSLAKFYEQMDTRVQIMMYVKERYPFDLLFSVFKETDIACHRLWHKPGEILRVYERIDAYLERFIDDQHNFFVVSDHGFGAFTKGIRINQYFLELGIVNRRSAGSEDGITHGSTHIQRLRFGAGGDRIYNLLGQAMHMFLMLGITRAEIKKGLKKIGLYGAMKQGLPNIMKRMLPPAKYTVDRTHSKAFLQSSRTSSVIINRSFYPMDARSEYERFREYLRQKLLEMRDPATGRGVIKQVFKREEIYKGEYIDRLPDLYIEAEDGYLIRSDLGETIFEFPVPKSSHDARGVFIGFGPDIAKGKRIEGRTIMDPAPTFLHLLDIAIPEDMDGSVLREIFREGSEPFQRQVKYAPPRKIDASAWVHKEAGDDETIEERLRALGYMD